MEKYNGQVVVPSIGPDDAELVLIGESPAFREVELGEPFVGNAGKFLNKGLQLAALDRSKAKILNLVPIRAPGDEFKRHSKDTLQWGLARLEEELSALRSAKLVVALGANPLRYLTGISGKITQWRGSLLRPDHWPLVDISIARGVPREHYRAIESLPHSVAVLPAYHPAAVARQYNWLWDLLQDFAVAARYLRGSWQPPPAKIWRVNDYAALPEFVDRLLADPSIPVAVDSEMDPFIVGLATPTEVHSFLWDDRARPAVERLMASDRLKIAHNWNHDATFFYRVLNVPVKGPLFDTQGAAHVLDPERRKQLSPDISTRFTSWPFHKWLVDYDPLVYCGMDAAVCVDSYTPMVEQLRAERLDAVLDHDHQLLEALLEMQWEGIPVNETERIKAEKQLAQELAVEEQKLRDLVRPVIRDQLHRFKKPHLFYVEKQCTCCGGGKVAREHCWRCGGLAEKPSKKADYLAGGLLECATGKCTVASLREQLPVCETCKGVGKVGHWLPFNPQSTDQVADVIYRGLGIKPRRYMGSETIRSERLEAIPNKPPLVEQVIRTSQVRAEYETVARLRPDPVDNKLHCVFDPWGTVSGRVAGKEGLIGVGTNPMNIPKSSRNMIVPPEGYGLMYPDMAAIESRNVAVLGNEETLLQIYNTREKVDSHTLVMEMIHKRTGFDMNSIDVGPHAGDGRHFTKRGTYAFMYGIRPPHLSGELGVDEEIAALILQMLEQALPGVRRYKEAVAEEIRLHRKVRSRTGRTRKFRDRIYEKDGTVMYEILKQGWSHSPQDMAAWVLAEGMFQLRREAPWIRRLAHVHDALLLAYPLHREAEAVEIAQRALSRELWGMWYPAGMSKGPNWAEAS